MQKGVFTRPVITGKLRLPVNTGTGKFRLPVTRLPVLPVGQGDLPVYGKLSPRHSTSLTGKPDLAVGFTPGLPFAISLVAQPEFLGKCARVLQQAARRRRGAGWVQILKNRPSHR